MTISETLLAEFENEAATTRRFLERLPADKLDWKPHPKSMTAGQLALHLAAAPGQVAQLAAMDDAPAPDFKRPNPQPKSVAEVLAAHDQGVEKVKNELSAISDARMHQTWRAVKPDGQELLAMPRLAFLRSILLNHTYHHRGQFGVYLRLLNAQVPWSYGPSADEAPDFAKPN